MKRVLWLIALLAFLPGQTLQGRATVQNDAGLALSYRAASDFALTADPNAPAWKDTAGVVADKGTRGDAVANHRTEIRSRWTEKNLYFLFVCPYENLHLKSKPSVTAETNMLWEWDVAEVFIGTDFGNIKRYTEFQVSPQGEWVDLMIDRNPQPAVHDWRWNSGFEVKARLDRAKKVWYGEMRIPFSKIDTRPPRAGQEMRINFYRLQGPPPKRLLINWQPVNSDSFHTPEAFGRLRLDESGARADRAASPPEARNFALPPTVADGAKLNIVYEADSFFEGPAWDPVSGKLYFTSFRKDQNQQILRLDAPGQVFVWMDQTQGVNGMRLSRAAGRLLGAQAYGHNLLSMKIGAAGPEDVKRLSSNFEGETYNQPNDLAEAPDGGIYYTDPDFKGKTRSAVYHLNPEGRVRRIITHLKIPNGILVSPDGKTLYVADSFEKRIYSYPILTDGSVEQGAVKVFFDPWTENQNDPDGMCADAEGNLYFAMRGGVWVASPKGSALGLIPVPEFSSNVAFGGKEGRTLFITCQGKVYSMEMKVKGAQFG